MIFVFAIVFFDGADGLMGSKRSKSVVSNLPIYIQ